MPNSLTCGVRPVPGSPKQMKMGKFRIPGRYSLALTARPGHQMKYCALTTPVENTRMLRVRLRLRINFYNTARPTRLLNRGCLSEVAEGWIFCPTGVAKVQFDMEEEIAKRQNYVPPMQMMYLGTLSSLVFPFIEFFRLNVANQCSGCFQTLDARYILWLQVEIAWAGRSSATGKSYCVTKRGVFCGNSFAVCHGVCLLVTEMWTLS
ncbi:hypothetical protein BKA63DRAFT_167972 [Paraphoma chrysanthemicola]|nr:hypothetical protein BKA63DRAFT_167972 [Paraphoma chrysanthemicola]